MNIKAQQSIAVHKGCVIKALLAGVVIAAYPASAQISASGTFVVIDRTKEKIVIAADSRAEFKGVDIEPRYDYCKIAAFQGKFVLATAGNAEYLSPFLSRWSNTQVARDAVEAAGPGATFQQVVNTWETRMWLNWLFEYKRNPDVGRKMAGGNAILTMGYWVYNSKSAREEIFFMISLREQMPLPIVILHPHGNCFDCGFSGHSFCFLGYPDIPAEMCAVHTPRGTTLLNSLTANLNAKSVIAVDFVAIGERYDSRHIGGPIDALELDDGARVRWLKRKPNCPSN